MYQTLTFDPRINPFLAKRRQSQSQPIELEDLPDSPAGNDYVRHGRLIGERRLFTLPSYYGELLDERILLGCWPESFAVHSFIVHEFAGGEDNFSSLPLAAADLQLIQDAIEQDQLPPTIRSMLWPSKAEENRHALRIVQQAARWLAAEDLSAERTVIYEAPQ